MRTPEEITRQIEGLLKMKTRLPEFSFFGEPNWEQIDAQVSILDGTNELSDIEEGDWEEIDDTNKIYRAAEDAENWLNEDTNDDLFEEEN